MLQLKHSMVLRGGATTSDNRFETSTIYVEASRVREGHESLRIEFFIGVPGGGTTRVVLLIDRGDFQAILREIANEIPESVAVLTDTAWIAIKKNLEALPHVWKVVEPEDRVQKAIADLRVVEEFVSDEYGAGPAGQNERETQVKAKLKAALNTFGELYGPTP